MLRSVGRKTRVGNLIERLLRRTCDGEVPAADLIELRDRGEDVWRALRF